MPKRIFEIRPITWLLEKGAVVICTGGGGIPTMYEPGTKTLSAPRSSIDKDRASALLAEELGADLFVMATDVDAVYLGLGDAGQRAIGITTPSAVAALSLPAGSMGPKVRRPRASCNGRANGRPSGRWASCRASWRGRTERASSRTRGAM